MECLRLKRISFENIICAGCTGIQFKIRQIQIVRLGDTGQIKKYTERVYILNHLFMILIIKIYLLKKKKEFMDIPMCYIIIEFSKPHLLQNYEKYLKLQRFTCQAPTCLKHTAHFGLVQFLHWVLQQPGQRVKPGFRVIKPHTNQSKTHFDFSSAFVFSYT